MLSRRRVVSALGSIALLICCAAAIPAQAGKRAPLLVVEGLGRSTVPLDGPWQFHTGDDAAWSNAAFDDSNWQQIDVSKPWGDQGHWDYTGYAWYRRHIEIKDEPNGAADVALYVPLASCSYEVYWNGRLIGSSVPMPGPSAEGQPPAAIFQLGKPGRGVLAIRAYSPPLDTSSQGDVAGLTGMPRIGGFEAIGNLAASVRATQVRSRLLVVAQVLIYFQLCLIGAVIWLRNRNQKLLFWMVAFLISAAFWALQDIVLFPWTETNILAGLMTGGPPHSAEDIALWYVLLYLLGLDRYPALVRWTRILGWTTLVFALLDCAVFYMPSVDAHALLFQVLDAAFTVGFSLPGIFPLILIALAFRRRMDLSRRLVAIAAFLNDMYFVVEHTAQQGVRFTRWTLANTMMRPLFSVDGVDVSMQAILSLVLVCAIVFAVYRYMVEQGQRQAALQQDFQNARAVQQVLIPEAIPRVTGFALDSVYQPAGDVGGDFFQILATPDGGVLAVIGDVSGKGMSAAMTVSLLVGTVRTLAHFTQSPAAILAAMNQRMLGRSQGGFTTCLAVRADADGKLTVANAGHIAPYLAGNELPLENSLPLGIAVDPPYTESVFRLAPGQQLTLLTDGIVEAREKSGALFGFERTEAISSQPASQIAKTAALFGQDDDITVLTLTRE
jgi:hypothetical protein